MTTPPEHPRDRIARIFAMGKYGEDLADEILVDFRRLMAHELEYAGFPEAAEYMEAVSRVLAGECSRTDPS